MYIAGIIIIAVLGLLIMDWHARMVFMARGYCGKRGHGKTWKRARAHYKSHWTFLQRMFWIPVFKEYYESKYRFLAYSTYVHAFFTLFTIVIFLVDELVLLNLYFWHYVFIAYTIIIIFRYIYNDTVARGKIRWW